MVICNSYYLEKRRGVNIEMKIAVCGKGGCGKSTVTSLLAKALARRGKETLVIDSDESDRKSTRLNSSHREKSRMPSSA